MAYRKAYLCDCGVILKSLSEVNNHLDIKENNLHIVICVFVTSLMLNSPTDNILISNNGKKWSLFKDGNNILKTKEII